VVGTDARVPVRRIWCVGRNYAAHAREMGADDREPPFFFSKPADALVTSGEVPYPPATRDLHHEVELVVALAGGGRDLAPEAALALVYGYAVGLDLTRRDLQHEAKKAGRPWDMAKGFDHSAPVGPLTRAADCGHLRAGRIALRVNGQLRQEADLADMTWNVGETLAHLSRLVGLQPGDLVFTGTPEGVGAVAVGDVLEAEVDRLTPLSVRIRKPLS
jgi:fumarylpyruvate hydrolase